MVAVFFFERIFMKSFKTISQEYIFELTEKRSKFIGTLRHIESEEDATNFINEMRSKYWDARHNVYAYALNEGNIKRFSDDGEPHGTAGKPVLDVLDGAELKNVAIVVTRYFGGVLLGTGGLVRAYSATAQGAVNSAVIKTMTDCREIEITCEYGMFDTLNNILKGILGGIIGTEFLNDIKIQIYINDAEADDFCARLIDTFNGKITIKTIKNKFYPI